MQKQQITAPELPTSSYPQKRYCGLSAQDGLRFMSALILPLMLGIFTVVVTLHQQNVAVQQRWEDRQLAKEQREQDMNISKQQRLEDRLIAREQREQDLNISFLQREHDKLIAKWQRDQDKEIAEKKQMVDEQLAEKQRNMTEQQRAHELIMSQEQLRDSLLVAYMNEIGLLLKETKGSLTIDPITAIVARAKTLAVIRRLDPMRNSYLIRFLYEAKQLTVGATPLNLSDAELNNIDLSSIGLRSNMQRLSLAGAQLKNASFANRNLSYSNFSSCNLESTIFKNTVLIETDFSYSTLIHVVFDKLKMTRAQFQQVRGRDVSFREVTASNSTFALSSFKQTVFWRCVCDNTNFSYSDFDITDFASAKIVQANFVATKMVRANMTAVKCDGANFTDADMKYAFLSSIICPKAVFVRTNLQNTTFYQAKAKDVDFSGADLRHATFKEADLTLATLSFTKIDGVDFTSANLELTNLSFTQMTNVIISNEQLMIAGSIRNTILRNGTFVARDHNLLHNGHADCELSVHGHWNVTPSNGISIVKLESDNCVFHGRNARMFQLVSMNRFRPLTHLERLTAVVTARCTGKRASLRATDLTDRPISNVNITDGSANLTLHLRTHTPRLMVIVEFGDNGWCDDLYVVAQSDTRKRL